MTLTPIRKHRSMSTNIDNHLYLVGDSIAIVGLSVVDFAVNACNVWNFSGGSDFNCGVGKSSNGRTCAAVPKIMFGF